MAGQRLIEGAIFLTAAMLKFRTGTSKRLFIEISRRYYAYPTGAKTDKEMLDKKQLQMKEVLRVDIKGKMDGTYLQGPLARSSLMHPDGGKKEEAQSRGAESLVRQICPQSIWKG